MSDAPFPLGSAAAVEPGAVLRVADTPVGPLALVRVDGRVHALRDRCPHAAASLSEGFVDGGRLVCPTHFAAFDVRTGIPTDAPPGCPAARTFAVSERDGGLYLASTETT